MLLLPFIKGGKLLLCAVHSLGCVHASVATIYVVQMGTKIAPKASVEKIPSECNDSAQDRKCEMILCELCGTHEIFIISLPRCPRSLSSSPSIHLSLSQCTSPTIFTRYSRKIFPNAFSGKYFSGKGQTL